MRCPCLIALFLVSVSAQACPPAGSTLPTTPPPPSQWQWTPTCTFESVYPRAQYTATTPAAAFEALKGTWRTELWTATAVDSSDISNIGLAITFVQAIQKVYMDIKSFGYVFGAGSSPFLENLANLTYLEFFNGPYPNSLLVQVSPGPGQLYGCLYWEPNTNGTLSYGWSTNATQYGCIKPSDFAAALAKGGGNPELFAMGVMTRCTVPPLGSVPPSPSLWNYTACSFSDLYPLDSYTAPASATFNSLAGTWNGSITTTAVDSEDIDIVPDLTSAFVTGQFSIDIVAGPPPSTRLTFPNLPSTLFGGGSRVGPSLTYGMDGMEITYLPGPYPNSIIVEILPRFSVGCFYWEEGANGSINYGWSLAYFEFGCIAPKDLSAALKYISGKPSIGPFASGTFFANGTLTNSARTARANSATRTAINSTFWLLVLMGLLACC